MISTILLFLLVLGLLVFVHEAGHFIVAKKSGMKVEEFGFGFPPRIVGIQKTGGRLRFVWGHKPAADVEKTVYSINWIPLGGFVKILGENNDESADPRSFVNQSFFRRLLTLLAGVLMNVVLAWALIAIGFMIGLPNDIPHLPSKDPFQKSYDVRRNIDRRFAAFFYQCRAL
jgi:regulator of sigma E protease